MTENREDLIRDLVADLRPVRTAGRFGRALLLWLALAAGYSVVVLLATGPLREGALLNVVREPAFGVETLIAALAIVALAHAALRSAIPDAVRSMRPLALPLAMMAVWISIYVVGFWHPAHPVSTLGMRPHCMLQTVLFSIPSLALMLWLARGLMPLRPRSTGLLGGAAAAAIPAALMQFGCMYVPEHILMFHIGPVFIVAAIGFAIGPFVLTRRRTVPRSRGIPMH